jgi:SAM-dependent methyltransferase
MFFRKSTIAPLPVTMSGVRMGERVLQIGIDDPSHVGAMAAKVGLSGNAAIAVSDEAAASRARTALATAGVLADLQVTTFQTLPFADYAFDVIVVHSMKGLLADLAPERRSALLTESLRVLRPGGRLVVIEAGDQSGLKAWLQSARHNETYEAAGGTVAALQSAGFKPVRVVGEREGYRFIEALRPRDFGAA